MVIATLTSYKELKKHLEEFERITFVQIVHRDSNMLMAVTNGPVIEKLTKSCYTLQLFLRTCVFVGKIENVGLGVRPRVSRV